MDLPLRIALQPTPEQALRLVALQREFAQVCNTLAPVVQQRKLWHRVTLHHLMYRGLREQFPALGSQMVCNAIYAVCRTARQLYQNPASPYGLAALQGAPLPLLQFLDASPVFFDRHTANVKEGLVSLYTLEGRIRCEADLDPAAAARFQQGRLRELVLERGADGRFTLLVQFSGEAGPAARGRAFAGGPFQLPDYVQIA